MGWKKFVKRVRKKTKKAVKRVRKGTKRVLKKAGEGVMRASAGTGAIGLHYAKKKGWKGALKKGRRMRKYGAMAAGAYFGAPLLAQGAGGLWNLGAKGVSGIGSLFGGGGAGAAADPYGLSLPGSSGGGGGWLSNLFGGGGGGAGGGGFLGLGGGGTLGIGQGGWLDKLSGLGEKYSNIRTGYQQGKLGGRVGRLQDEVLSELGRTKDVGPYRQQMFKDIWGQVEPRFAADMFRRGLAGSSAYGSGMADLMTKAAKQAYYGGEDLRKQAAQEQMQKLGLYNRMQGYYR